MLQTLQQSKSHMIGAIEICEECHNYATIGKKIPHKKTCSFRPQKAMTHIWESQEEYARWEKAQAQIAKENAMPFGKLKDVLYKEALKGFKYPVYVRAQSGKEGIAVRACNGGSYNGKNFYGITVYAGTTLAHYWHEVLGITTDTPAPEQTAQHVWQDPNEAARWQRVTAQNDKEAKMPFQKLLAKLQQESNKGGSPYGISFAYGEGYVKVYDRNYTEQPVYQGATLVDYWTQTLAQTQEVRV
jgi:hypothetical protein